MVPYLEKYPLLKVMDLVLHLQELKDYLESMQVQVRQFQLLPKHMVGMDNLFNQ